MKRFVNSISVLIIFALLSMSISYAFNNTSSIENETEPFFEVNSNEIAVGETLEMTINLNLIDLENIKFTLSSDLDISTTYSENEIELENEERLVNNEENTLDENQSNQTTTTENTTNETNITQSSNVETQVNAISFEINKKQLGVEKIVLYYIIPDSLEIGDTFNLVATISDTQEKNMEQIDLEITIVEAAEDENIENKAGDIENTAEDEENTEVTVENNYLNNTENQTSDDLTMNENNANINSSEEISDSTQNAEEKSQQSTSSDVSSTESISTEETVTYNGSSNNYLSELYIDGYSLTQDFNKENSTYFATVSDENSVSIIATAESSCATVCIYGEDSLSEGSNKVLISVTAENGNVRYYRIYITN